MSRPRGLVIVGWGSAGRQHAEALRLLDSLGRRPLELLGVVDEDPAKAFQAAESAGVPALTLDQALSDGRVDAVSICTPPGSHCDIALAALNAGKAILVEKPVVGDMAELERIVSCSRLAGRPALAMLQHRGRLPAEALEVGWSADACASVVVMRHRPVTHFEAASWRTDPAQSGGGHVAHLAVHQIDLACQLLGVPVDVLGLFDCRDAARIETRSALAIQFAGGALMTVLASAHPSPRVDSVRILDDDRELEVGAALTRYAHRGEMREWSADTRALRAEVYADLGEALADGNLDGRYSIERTRGVTFVLERVRLALQALSTDDGAC